VLQLSVIYRNLVSLWRPLADRFFAHNLLITFIIN